MDCAINAAVTSAVGAAGGQQAGSTTLCDMGKRFAELVQQAPTGAGAPAITPPSAIVETYVPAVTNTSAGSGGTLLVSGIDHLLSLPQISPAGQESALTSGSDEMPQDLQWMHANLAIAAQKESLEITMIGAIVNSMTTGVRTLFQQQG